MSIGERTKPDFFFYSLTIMPHEDTPAKLAAYAEMHEVRKNWLFLTGKPDDLELLRARLGYRDPKSRKRQQGQGTARQHGEGPDLALGKADFVLGKAEFDFGNQFSSIENRLFALRNQILALVLPTAKSGPTNESPAQLRMADRRRLILWSSQASSAQRAR